MERILSFKAQSGKKKPSVYSRDVLRNGQSTNSHRENPVVVQGILFLFTGISLLVPCSTLYGILVYSTDYIMPLVFGVVYPYLQSFRSSILRISVCNVIKSTEAFFRSALAFG